MRPVYARYIAPCSCHLAAAITAGPAAAAASAADGERRPDQLLLALQKARSGAQGGRKIRQ